MIYYLVFIFIIGLITGVRIRPYLERRFHELRGSVNKSESRGREEVRRRYESAIYDTFAGGQPDNFKARQEYEKGIYTDGAIVVLAKN